ncbi:MAG: hypothetical protein J6S22_02785, partial [Clostridia bacterium]|nr:hypothetical protein [Clostridia bacterium]
FGMFLRSLRKTCRNGVVFTICSELESSFEGETLVLSTDSEAIYKSLRRPEHDVLFKEALAAIGVTSFELRMQGKKEDGIAAKLNQIRSDFSNTPIEIK